MKRKTRIPKEHTLNLRSYLIYRGIPRQLATTLTPQGFDLSVASIAALTKASYVTPDPRGVLAIIEDFFAPPEVIVGTW